ncbi:zinc finger protein 136-like isoform X1 [Anastrepha ludens]|uniref:zinc finger protein 136-like isoform X1 n=1 Tax=Anastrepha ludens TaxID=28586 RepID=UPI0023B0B766|nr:zinc finger protein 136-like isoform X1 [Anastrepha ludens]
MDALQSSNEAERSNGTAADVSLRFYSFLPITQPKKTWPTNPKTSGYCTDTSGVLVINDSEDEDSSTISAVSEPQFEFLCEIDVDKNIALPRPIELKVECKKEPEDFLGAQQNQKPANEKRQTSTLTAATTDNGDCEDELLTLCKIEPVCDLNEVMPNNASEQENHYIYFTCPQCGERHDSHPHWRRHIVSAHQLGDKKKWNFKQRPNNEFECNSCRKVFTRCTLKTLQQHHFTHLPHKVYHCKLCPFEEHSMFLMVSHIMLHRETDASSSGNAKSNNGAPTAREIALWEHESRALIAYVCPACGLTFDAEDTWQAHINFSHNFLEKTAENRFGDHFKCSECGVEIFSQHIADLQQHLFTHLAYKSYLKCKICSFTISRRNFMLSHILNLHKVHLSAGAIANGGTVMSADTPTITTTRGLSPVPVTTTTSPRRKRSHDGRISHDGGLRESENSNINSMNVFQSTLRPHNDNNIRTRRASAAYRQLNNTYTSSSDALETAPKTILRKGSFTCEKCTKHYLYRKSFSKHLRYCNPNNMTI